MKKKNEGQAKSLPKNSAEELSFFQQYDLVAQSGLFDSDFYSSQNGGPSAQGVDSVLHYLEVGASQGLAPHPDFDPTDYLKQCAKRGIKAFNPLLHYLLEGKRLGIKPKPVVGMPAQQNSHQWMVDRVLPTGVFDLAFYKAAHGLSFESDADGLRHFFTDGGKTGNRPNLYFDPIWYSKKYPDVQPSGVHPLIHYLFQGDAEGRQPSLIFDAAWYRRTYRVPANQNALLHYLANRRTCLYSPVAEFDVAHYADINKDVRAAGMDPFEHFLLTGYREGRHPSATFNVRNYARRYLNGSTDINPLLHYLEHKGSLKLQIAQDEDEVSVPKAIKRYTRPAPEFEEFKPLPDSAPRRAKVLAYYLPQFHAFPENDEWWGKGFTEWTNIARGVSRFDGHFQPRIPRDLGFYSLESTETIKRQVAMAKQAGLFGFVFYYYWFNGKRLMQLPVENFLADASIDMPFALMWANENWTRRWDGADSQVLISQDYDPDDDVALVRDFVRHFRDPRYIRIDGRPVLMIYRPGLIPKAKRLIARWRELFKSEFNENPILIMAQGFGDSDPQVYGLDGGIEFPPHKLAVDLPMINDKLNVADPDFFGEVFSYDDLAAKSLSEPMPDYPLIKTAVPSWDNDCRRQGGGMVFAGSTPAKYEAWMRALVSNAEKRPFFGEPLVCVNAWNEWCEAAYLEPDLHYGSAYLNATGRAVSGVVAQADGVKLLLVGHDACANGAQELLLNIARRLRAAYGVELAILLLDGGPMEKAYREVATVHIANDLPTVVRTLANLKKQGFSNALVNSVASGRILKSMNEAGFEFVTLVHELPRIIRDMGLQAGAQAALSLSRHVIFPADVVRRQVAEEVGLALDERMRIMPQGSYKQFVATAADAKKLRKSLGIKEGEQLVLGVGYGDLRKGFDLFLQLWRQANADARSKVHFCWVGNIEKSLETWLANEIEIGKKLGTLHLPGFREDVDAYLLAADTFVLSSREDPFPTVVHEALTAGLPVLLFANSGGMPDFLRAHDMGMVIPYGDVSAMAVALRKQLTAGRSPTDVKRRQAFVKAELDFGRYVRGLLQLALPSLETVSVAVPNYNYAQHLPARLSTVFQQSYPVAEVLVLDDASKDDSLKVIERVAAEWRREINLMPNASNSGSVIQQWRKAAEAATGEFIWIAEADDLSEPGFLRALIETMRTDRSISIGFCDSRTIDGDDKHLADSYKSYYAEIEPGALSESAIFEGADFARRFLAERNLILNVSSVVWRRTALLCALDACQTDLNTLQMAGDWRLYLEVLAQPGTKISYIASSLNVHRRHASSVTHALQAKKHVDEIAKVQKFAVKALKLSTAAQQRQTNYLKAVGAQLGVRA